MIAVITGGRSDFGILSPLIDRLDARVITCVEPEVDSPLGIALAASETARKVALDLAPLNPRRVVVLGDRYEVLAATTAAYNLGIPIAHLHGGEVTRGSRDDSMRHAITMLADLHLCATDRAANRVRDFGKHDVHVVGAMGAYNARRALPAATDTSIIVSVPADPKVFEAVIEATQGLDPLIIGPNADCGYSQMSGANLTSTDFLSMLKAARVIVGNSSCGIIEAPSAGTWTVNVGDRQRGRERAASVIDVGLDPYEIRAAVDEALGRDLPNVANPYDHGDACELAAALITA